MKASEILPIAEKWKKVFETLLQKTTRYEELQNIAWINERFIIMLQAEDFLNQEKKELPDTPAEFNSSYAYMYFLHMNNILERYPSEISPSNSQRWFYTTPYQAYNQRKSLRQVLFIIAFMMGACKDLYLLLTSSLTLPALLTLSHLTFLVLPLMALGVWIIFDKYVYFPFDNHSFNLVHTAPDLKIIMQGMIPNNRSHVGFFDNQKNKELITLIDNEYRNFQFIS